MEKHDISKLSTEALVCFLRTTAQVPESAATVLQGESTPPAAPRPICMFVKQDYAMNTDRGLNSYAHKPPFLKKKKNSASL